MKDCENSRSKDVFEFRGCSSAVTETSFDDLKAAGEMILAATSEDLTRDGLVRTPERFSKAISYLLSGYESSEQDVVGQGVFPAEGRGMVEVGQLEFYSMCEHHLLPFWGTADIAYFPQDQILGLSKLPRLVDLYSRRVQVQERLTEQVCNAVDRLIRPRAVMVRVQAQHMCMMMRGVQKQLSATKTTAVRGFDNLQTFEKVQAEKFFV